MSGRCRDCTAPPVEGRTRCEGHLATARDAARARVAARKSLGLCIKCHRKATDGKATCRRHTRAMAGLFT